ncbi:MAG: glycosyltransferase [Actinomycetota bacterium]|nr:glycosyltransferase [Actinomycetota bacterium]
MTEQIAVSDEAIEAAPQPLILRTAIVHDWFQGFHGSERVVDAMRTGLFAAGNEPDVYTFHAARELLPEGLAAAIVRESRVARLPGIRQQGHDPGRWRYLLPLMPRYFRRLPLDDYDLVIASSHACAVQARPREDVVYVCYCYTPIRYAWLAGDDRDRVGGIKGAALRAAASRLRRSDLEASRRPDLYMAISSAVRERVQRFYGRDAAVVHPPVDVEDFTPTQGDPDHFLWVHRLVRYKRPDLVAEAFRDLPYRLTMVGVGPMEAELRKNLPPNVELRSWVSREELIQLYQQAGGFVHVGEEDFGITMVEALAAGTPVIALNAGGARDIVRDRVDGALIGATDVSALRDAVRSVRNTAWSAEDLNRRAGSFSRARFIQKLSSHIRDQMDSRRNAN